MNTKSSRQHRSAAARKLINANKDEAEVFVLPPNLLEKLGIQLGNIESTQGCPTQSNKTDQRAVQTKDKKMEKYQDTNIESVNTMPLKTSPIQKDTSILETATLMKESVLLSPTFVPTVANVIPGEVEIANVFDQSVKTATNDDLDIEHNLVDSFDIQQLMNSSNENGVIEFAEKILQSNQKQEENVHTQKININNFEETHIQTESINLERTMKELEVREESLENTICIKKKSSENSLEKSIITNSLTEAETVFGQQLLQDDSATIGSNDLKNSLNKIDAIINPQLFPVQLSFLETNYINANESGKFVDLQSAEGENQVILEHMDDCDKITLEDLEIKESLPATLLPNELESFQLDCKVSTEMLQNNATGSSISANEIENTTTNKVQILSQEILNLKPLGDGVIASQLNKNNLIPVTIDTVITTRQDNYFNCNNTESNKKILDHSRSYHDMISDRQDDYRKHEVGNEQSFNTLPDNNHKINEKLPCFNDLLNNESINNDNITNTIEKPKEIMCSNDNVSAHYSINLKNQNELKRNHELAMSNNFNEIPNIKTEINKPLPSLNNNTISNIELIRTQNETNYNGCDNMKELEKQRIELKWSNALSNNVKDNKSPEIQTQSNLILDDQLLGMTKIKLNHEIKSKKKYSPTLPMVKRNKEKATQSFNGPSKLKNCVQGVEKPGGDDLVPYSISKEGLKTYQRIKSKTPKICDLRNGNEIANLLSNNDIDIVSNENTDIDLADTVLEFCLCKDFGQFANYDESDIYEHIHFWQTETVNCKPELIFSIYYENTTEINHEYQSNIEDIGVTHEETTPICWKAISIQGKEVYYDYNAYLHRGTDIETEISSVNTFSPVLENSRKNIPVSDRPEVTSNSDTKVLVNCNNVDENKGLATDNNQNSQFAMVSSHTHSNVEAVDELISEAIIRDVNTDNLQPCSTILSTKMLVEANNKNNERVVNTLEIMKNFKGDITKKKNNNATKHLKSNDIDQATSSRKDEQENQPLQNLKNEPENVITNQNTYVDSQVENLNDLGVVHIMKNNSYSKVVNKAITKSAVGTEAVENSRDADRDNENVKQLQGLTESGAGKTKKRRKSSCGSADATKMDEPPSKKTVKCGVCMELLSELDWDNHVIQMHNSVAWKEGRMMNFDDEHYLEQLNQQLKINGILECSICNFKINHLATFILHLQRCVELKMTKDAEELKKIKCGACKNDISVKRWSKHLVEHNYLAWVDGDAELDLNDENMVHRHLYALCEELGGLKCKCGVRRLKVQNFIKHLTNCKNQGTLSNIKDSPILVNKVAKTDTMEAENCSSASEIVESTEEVESQVAENMQESVKCGVCMHILDPKLWEEHIKDHNYLAWKDGEPALDLADETLVRRHLCAVSRQIGGLICKICGQKRKQGKKYLDHMRECKAENTVGIIDSANNRIGSPDVTFDSSVENSIKQEYADPPVAEDLSDKPQISKIVIEGGNTDGTNITTVVCAVCNNNVDVTKWFSHIELQHNYLAWKVGEKPIDLENEFQVLQHLKNILSEWSVLICNKCGLNRKYAKPYRNHILHCDGTIQYSNSSRNTSLDCSTALDSDSSRRGSIECVRPGRPRKRRRVISYSDEEEETVSSKRRLIAPEVTVRCGVCKMDVQESMWYTHIGMTHKYLAWKEGEAAINVEDEKEVWCHLLTLSQILDKLVCYKCNLGRKKPKAYLEHIKNCSVTVEETDQGSMKSVSTIENKESKVQIITSVKIEHEGVKGTTTECKHVTCAVCKKSVEKRAWIQHIKENHNYLAWVEGKPALNLDDEDAVRDHLRTISKKQNGLVCIKCQIIKKYPKMFLKHIRDCTGLQNDPLPDREEFMYKDMEKSTKCGVCSKTIESGGWIKHIQVAHNYLAWREGDNPIALDNEDAVKEHLTKILRHVSHLICAKCGFTRRTAGYYMTHMETCGGALPGEVFEDRETLLSKNNGFYECAMCHEKVLPNDWQDHAFNKHYNVTWIVGDIPIDLKSPYGADIYLKEYKQKKDKLVCNLCGESRASLQGFYVHIITCGKSEEEMEIYKEDCTICGKRYLGVYRTQHIAAHREEELSKMRKSEIHEQSDEEGIELSPTIGRRKAAEKANIVIEKYKSDKKFEFAYKCDSCNFGTDSLKKLQSHKCDMDVIEGSEESESSEESEEDSFSEEDEDISDEVDDVRRAVERKKELPKPSWLPFKLLKWKPYYEQLLDSFNTMNLAENSLFPEWLITSYSFVPNDQVMEYMPKVEQSCKVNINGSWREFKKFEGQKFNRGHSIFVGGSIQRISWVPCKLKSETDEHNFLAVTAHLTSDTPRHNYDHLVAHPGLIQIWDAGTFDINAPNLALGIAHDYGAVWSIDWCPSGVREKFNESSENKEWKRLGLLAIACSNGSAYILSVPYPTSITTSSDNIFVKLKPVAELRLCSKELDRKKVQATAISWSKKKGHADVVVAYADGSIARYDLTNSSPMLMATEDDMTIFYPYYDERSLNACVTGLDSFPGVGGVADFVCGTCPTGSVMASGRPRPDRVTSHLPASDAAFTPAWPTVMLSTDEGLVHQTPNELDWHGCGRKLGVLCSSAACEHCGRVLVSTPPLLRASRHFPPCIEVARRAVASISVVPLRRRQKQEKQKNDELSIKMEPTTYEDVVEKYGVEFKILDTYKPALTAKEPFPERFPLAEISSMAFCTSAKYHDRVAVATHSGVIFIFRQL